MAQQLFGQEQKSQRAKTRQMSLAIGLSMMLPVALPQLSTAQSSWSSDYSKGLAADAAQNPAAAEDFFRKALAEMAKAPHKPADQENCMRKLADALMLRGKTGEAQTIYQNLLTQLSNRYGVKSGKTAPILMILGSIQESLGDHSAAMALYQRALQINEKSFGPYSPEFAGNLHQLGRASYKAGNKTAAQKNYKKALSILSTDPGLDASHELRSLLKDYNDLIKSDDQSNRDLIKDFDRDIYGTKKNSAGDKAVSPQSSDAGRSAWQTQNSFKLNAQAQAQTNQDPQVELRGISRPTTDENLAPVYKTMSETIFNQSHFEKGEDYYKRKIAIDVEALGPEHPSVANDLCGLAMFYVTRQNYGQAKPLLARALGIYQRVWGDNNLLTVNTRVSLASAEFHLGNIEAAAALYRQALSQGQSLSPNNLETARALNDLAYLYFHQGKLQEACTFYEWALASTESAVGQKDPLLAACLKDYAQVLKGLGRTAEAGAAESRAESILNKVQ